MNDLEMIEKYAKMMAVGNNGGSWDAHYKEEHKELWRGRAAELISDCYDLIKSGKAPMKPLPAQSD